MKKCFLCNKKTSFYKKFNRIIINQCIGCKLAFTNNHPKTKNLYKNTVYNLDQYLSLKRLQENKFLNISNKINQVISQGDILEVGAGFGLFSSILSKNNKYHIEVIEPNLPLHFIQENYKVTKHKKTYEEFLKSNKKKYDCVILLDVLEHFYNPGLILKQTKNILKNKGFIVIQFPNYKSLMASLCKDWSWWMVEDHKFHFSPNSSKLLLNKEGYNIIYLRTYESLYDFKKNLDGNFSKIKNSTLRKAIKIIYLSLFFPLYILLRKFLWYLGYGGLIFIIAQKKSN